MSEVIVPNHDDLLKRSLRLYSPWQDNPSAWTGNSKTVGQPGIEKWLGSVAIGDIATELEEREWRAFLWQLSDPANWFKWLLPCQSHDGDKPVVGSSPGNGYTLPLAGLTPNASILTAGQYLVVPLPSGKYRTLGLTAALNSDGSGNATAQFKPALSETPTIGVTVETLDPFIAMRPAVDTLGLDTDQGVSGASFDVRENR